MSNCGHETRNEPFACIWSFWFCPTNCVRKSKRRAASNHATVLHVYADYARDDLRRRRRRQRRKLLMFTRPPRVAVIEQLIRSSELLTKVNKCFLKNVLLQICECAMQPRAKLTQIMRIVTKKLRRQDSLNNDDNAMLWLKKCGGAGAYRLSLPKLPVIVIDDNDNVPSGMSSSNTLKISAQV